MFLLTNRYVLHMLSMATFLHICQARSLANESSTDGLLWQPAEGTRDEWLACRGMPKDVCERTKIKKQELQKALAKKFGLDDRPIASYTSPSDVDECIVFTEEQLDTMIAEAKNEEKATSAHRKKRTLTDFTKYKFSKWPMPIPFMFDGTHDDDQKAKIRAAFQHWADNTCVRFEELPTNARFNSSYILIESNETNGCSSYVGRIRSIPQQINLASRCVEAFGAILHEIGHSLGLYHEQSRFDRNDSIKILWNNLKIDAWPQYLEADTDSLGVPYNYGSVMHYSSKSDNSVNGDDTLIALEPLYQLNMGQSVDLSFHDRKIINLGYCTGFCAAPLTQPCQRSGYQNPNNCSTCICPGGFAGQYCDEIAQPQNANCGSILNIESGTQQVIKSPGYDSTGYSQHQECTWLIKAPANYTLELEFSEDFDILCSSVSACSFHWVEVKYKKDLGLEGARFCCDSRPSDIVISESNEIMVIFQSNYSTPFRLRGFEASITSFPPVTSSSSPPSTTTSSYISTPLSTSFISTPLSTKTTSSSTLTSSSSSTISASTSTVSTATSSTTTQIVNGRSLFRCSFETTSRSNDTLCGMTQDTTDQFDWTVYHDPTPSDSTGPDTPFAGDLYVYIEASEPRQPNDEARLLFPKMNFTGEVCVDFWYHMYGFHINTLKLVRITGSQSTDLWSKTGQIGNFWLYASVGVHLSTNIQLQFIGIRGEEYSGDIGLDRVEVRSGPCCDG